MAKLEAIVAGVCLGAWLLAGVFYLTGMPGPRAFASPYTLFPFAAALGWLAGNVYVARVRAAPLGRRGLLAVYLGGPPGLIWLAWALFPGGIRQAAPLAPVLALGVFGIFYLVPVTLRRFPRGRG